MTPTHDRPERSAAAQPNGLHDWLVAAFAWAFLAFAASGLAVSPLGAQEHGANEQHAQEGRGADEGAGHSAQGHGNEGDSGQHGDGEHAHGDGGHGDGGHGDGGHGEHKPLAEMSAKDIFEHFYVHLMPHAVFTPPLSPDASVNESLTFYDVNLFQLFAVGLIFLVFLPVLASFGNAHPAFLIRVFRGWCLWLRDEVVYATMGAEEGRRWLPFFLYMFFFIAFANLMGLIPKSVTATGTIYVTAALSGITFVLMVFGGMLRQGPANYWKNLIPHGVPPAMVVLLFPLEVIGLLVKPVALAIRLFANMLAGHLVLYSFLGLIFLFAKMVEQSALAYPLALPGIGLAVFIFIIEGFVALLQAYIFTLLSCIFIQQALHPDH